MASEKAKLPILTQYIMNEWGFIYNESLTPRENLETTMMNIKYSNPLKLRRPTPTLNKTILEELEKVWLVVDAVEFGILIPKPTMYINILFE